MCGIFCSISSADCPLDDVAGLRETFQLLARRGPDRSGEHQHITTTIDGRPHRHLRFRGQVLWQQGAQPCDQPSVRNGHVLLLNGDVFTVREMADVQSDTEWLLERLDECQADEQLRALFRSTVRGPFSLIYYNATTNSLYFGRDSLGRQTLLLGSLPNRKQSGGDLIISSVVSKQLIGSTDGLLELPPLGLYKISLDSGAWSLYPWQELSTHCVHSEQLHELSTKLVVDIAVCDIIQPEWLSVPDAGAIAAAPPAWSFETITNGVPDVHRQKPDELFDTMLRNENVASTCDELLTLLDESVRERCLATPPLCRNCLHKDDAGAAGTAPAESSCQHCRVAVLFSGGLDCTILALLADRYMPADCPIDLLNVSFEKVRKTIVDGAPIDYNTPDRLSARESLHELRALRPQRVWQLVEADISRGELQTELASHIAHLVHPLDTVLDESLGAALWFASRGKGSCDGVEYTSPARVLLHGSGADELFGGYTRHRNAFVRNGGGGEAGDNAAGWTALSAELLLDWTRLPARNLARDDRVCADHGRTARAPYVQETVAAFVLRLAAQQRCMHSLAAGVGDKLLLRLVGSRLGLRGAAALRKRALQFGSRIADSRQNARDRSGAMRTEGE